MSLILSGTDGVQDNSGAIARDTANGGGTNPFPGTGGPTAVNYTTTVPSWAKRITVVFSGVSTSGTSVKQIQIGSGSIVTSGYVCVGGTFYSSNIAGATSFTSGFVVNSNAAGDVLNGTMTLTNVSGNIWVALGVFSNAVSTPQVFVTNGSLTLGGTLDRVRITTFNGTDLFDAGTVNLIYE